MRPRLAPSNPNSPPTITLYSSLYSLDVFATLSKMSCTSRQIWYTGAVRFPRYFGQASFGRTTWASDEWGDGGSVPWPNRLCSMVDHRSVLMVSCTWLPVIRERLKSKQQPHRGKAPDKMNECQKCAIMPWTILTSDLLVAYGTLWRTSRVPRCHPSELAQFCIRRTSQKDGTHRQNLFVLILGQAIHDFGENCC